MKSARLFFYSMILVLSIFCASGYANEEGHGHDHDHDEKVSGATFKPGEGVIVSDETQKILGLEIADVAEKNIPKLVQLHVQIFGESHRYLDADMDHAGCDVHGSGFLMPDQASLVEPKQPVTILTRSGQSLEGFVLSVNRTLQGETEVLVGVKEAATKLKEGDFATATIAIPRNKPSVVIPRSALLRTAEGDFAYTVHEDAFLKKSVNVGSETSEYVEIADGLSPGDKIVVKPVETLWLIELRVTKGGGHSH